MITRTPQDKATHGQLKRHNREMLLRAVYSGLADNRAALAQETGLAKPTVSELVGELIDEGLLVEQGHGPSTRGGGKRPRLLRFVPTARHVIGVSLNEKRALGVLATLDGQGIAQHYVDLAGAQGDAVIAALMDVINGLLAQADAPLLCIGIGVLGVVEADGSVSYAPQMGWHRVPLAQRLTAQYGVPVYVAHNTALAAMAQYVFGPVADVERFTTVLGGESVGVGVVINGVPYHGGGDIGHLSLAAPTPDGVASEDRIETFLGWPWVRERARVLCRMWPESRLPGDGEPLSYLHLRYAADYGDPAALALRDELSRHLAQIFAWIIGLLRPHHISLAGPIAHFGPPLLDQAVGYTRQLVLPGLVDQVVFSLTEADSAHLAATGAVAQGLQRELGLV